MDLYEQLLSRQQWGSTGAVERYLTSRSVLSFPHVLPPRVQGEIPFEFLEKRPFSLEEHSDIFGIRWVENPKEAQEMETEAYIPATMEAHMKQLAEKAIEEYLGLLERTFPLKNQTTLSIMDVGCGTGHLLLGIGKKLEERYPHLKVTCGLLDKSENMLGQAQKTFEDWKKKHPVFFLCQEIEAPVAPEFHCDVVLSHTMLHHLEQPEHALKQMSALAKKLLMVRDLSRPPLHLFMDIFSTQGRAYEGVMKQLFKNSLMSSLSYPEFCVLAKRMGARVETILPMYQVLSLAK